MLAEIAERTAAGPCSSLDKLCPVTFKVSNICALTLLMGDGNATPYLKYLKA